MLEGQLLNNDNLHRIAISNIQDQEYRLRKWWRKKWKRPEKDIDDMTIEEVFLENLEDFYEADERRIEEFHVSLAAETEEEWDGEFDEDVEKRLEEERLRVFGKREGILDQYVTESDKNLSDEDIEQRMRDVGKDLPGSKKKKKNPIMGEDEFEDTFGDE